jgi:hypothetical protein
MAAEFQFPSEIDPLGEGYRKNLDFQKVPQTRVKSITVRVGEIVRGRIVEVLSPKQAVIDLPDGTFTAEISGRFNPGDELFFKVNSTDPALVLKIYSTFSRVQNKELPVDEIIRLLDLPSSSLFQKIIENEKKQANVIIREDVLLVSQFASKILEKFPKADIDQILKFIYFAMQLKIEPAVDFFETYLKMLDFAKHLPSIINSLLLQRNSLPDSLKEKFGNLLNALQRPVFSSIFSLFSPNTFTNDANIFSTLLNLRNSTDYTSLPASLKQLVDEILSGFSAFWILNSALVHTNPSLMFVFVPFLFDGKLNYTIVRYKRRKIGTRYQYNVEFEDDEAIKPIGEALKKDMEEFFNNEDNAQQLFNSQREYQRQSRKESNRIVIKLPSSEVRILKLLPSGTDNSRKVSIVI